MSLFFPVAKICVPTTGLRFSSPLFEIKNQSGKIALRNTGNYFSSRDWNAFCKRYFMERLEQDTQWHRQLRKQLVSGLRKKGISDERVLASISKLPRHFFMDKSLEARAYEDRPLPFAEGQTISQPYTVAYQTQLLDVHLHHKILEIGTGSGYQACVLAYMGTQVYTVERQKKIFDANEEFTFLQQFQNIHCFYADGYNGLPDFAPFDRILITAAIPAMTSVLIDQLNPGGILVAPVGGGKGQQMQRIIKKTDGTAANEHYGNFSFVPMLEGRTE
jgi:protein-L-isoaspartate(D-aspartate) O-methyltransferase